MAATSVTAAKVVQRLKSALAAPVVVIIETNWKTEALIASSPLAIPSVQSSRVRTSEPSRSSVT